MARTRLHKRRFFDDPIKICEITGSIDKYDPKFELTDLFFATANCDDDTVVKEGSCVQVGCLVEEGDNLTQINEETKEFVAYIPMMGVATEENDDLEEMSFESFLSIICDHDMKLANGSGYRSEESLEVVVKEVKFFSRNWGFSVSLGNPYFADEENRCTTIMMEG